MRRILALLLVCLCVAACGNSKEVKPNSASFSAEQIQQAWETAGTPNENHRALAPLVGSWSARVKTWMSPQGSAEESLATAHADWILGGRFLKEQFQGKAMGKSMSGIGVLGFDNVTGKYTSMWIDSLTTSMMTSEGSRDQTGTKFEFVGNYIDPVSKEVKRTRSVTSIVNNEKRVFEMYEALPNGSEFKSLEISYTRR